MIPTFIDATSLLILLASGHALAIAEQHDLGYYMSASHRRRIEATLERAKMGETLHPLLQAARLSEVTARGATEDIFALSSSLGTSMAGLVAAALTVTDEVVVVTDDVRTLRVLRQERPQLQLITAVFLLRQHVQNCPDAKIAQILEKLAPWFSPSRTHPEAKWWATYRPTALDH